MKCPKCNFDNPADIKFCGECAAPLHPSEEISVAETETAETLIKELTTGSIFAERYQIIEELGKGGMGNVYKIFDKKIKEKVALKLLKPEIGTDKKTIERFSNELKFARKISHRNVCRMYDLGEEEGNHYITMEYVPGEDLKSTIIRVGQLSVGKTIFIAKQVCEGLAEAHRLGVVHRDLKPQNIMLDKEGNVRIMDFGIARSLKTKRLTAAGVIIGTPEYISPEQVEGKETDQRSDIYSLGVILYEMITGRIPFEGETPLSIAVKHKSETPQDPKELNSQIPEDLARLILRCMEKDKEKRYQGADELLSELIKIEKGIPTTERVIPKRKPITSKEITVTFGLKKLFIPALVVIVIVIIGVIIWRLFPEKEAVSLLPSKSSIAVLPFEDLSPQRDQDHFCDGMTDDIIAKLSKLEGLKVISRTSVMRYKNKDEDVKVIGRELGVATIVEGSVRRENNNIRVNAKLINVEDGFHLWAETYDRELINVFDIQSDVAGKIARALKAKLSPEEIEGIEKKPTENLEAYSLYLKGRWLWNKRTEEDLNKAIEYFEQAIEEDPNYSLAYVGLADSYIVLPDYSPFPTKKAYPMAKEAVLKALEIDSTLAEAYTSLAMVKESFGWDWSGAERDYKRAIELSPGYATAHHWYGFHLMYLGRHDEAIAEIKLAQELDPLSLVISRNLGQFFYFARQYDQAIEALQRTMDMDPNFSGIHGYLGDAYLQKSMYEEALAEFQKGMSQSAIGITYAKMGRREEALQLLDDLIKRSKEEYVSPLGVARFYFALGENDQGFEWLDKAYEERDGLLCVLKIDPECDSVRSDTRFTALLKKMGLE
ncbi:Serine/threonine-protein kinase PknD [subsurface metagenome]